MPTNMPVFSLAQLRQQLRPKFRAFNVVSGLFELDQLLSHELGLSAAELLIANQSMNWTQQQQLLDKARQYLHGKPLAYILGTSEFLGLSFKVTTNVLIPRADSEPMVCWLAAYLRELNTQWTHRNTDHERTPQRFNVVDLGTGSGCLSIGLATQLGSLDNSMALEFTLVDCSSAALAIAKENYHQWQRQCDHSAFRFVQSDWFSKLRGQKFDVILSNPPYIDPTGKDFDPSLLNYEPKQALYSQQQGLADLSLIIESAPDYLNPHGLLIVEHGYQQQHSVQRLMQQAQLQRIQTHTDLANHPRFSCGVMPGDVGIKHC